MTLTFELDLDSVKMNKQAKYLRPRSSNSNVLSRTRTQTHIRSTALPGPLMRPSPVRTKPQKLRAIQSCSYLVRDSSEHR